MSSIASLAPSAEFTDTLLKRIWKLWHWRGVKSRQSVNSMMFIHLSQLLRMHVRCYAWSGSCVTLSLFLCSCPPPSQIHVSLLERILFFFQKLPCLLTWNSGSICVFAPLLAITLENCSSSPDICVTLKLQVSEFVSS